MSLNFWLTEAQFKKIQTIATEQAAWALPACATCLQQAGRQVLSGIIFCLQRGYRWSDVPEEYGPAKTLYNRYRRWSPACSRQGGGCVRTHIQGFSR